jgi:hypothetical protein
MSVIDSGYCKQLIIPNDSCHPTQHKLAAIRFLRNRCDTYQLNDGNNDLENATIDQILRNNNYDASYTHKPLKPQNSSKTPHLIIKSARFTYVGKETRYIKKLFRNTFVRIAYTTKNTIQKILFTPPQPLQISTANQVYMD